jgi:hypothetical protein
VDPLFPYAALLGGLVGFPVMLLVHECGHAVAARLAGFRVNRVELGSGPVRFRGRWRGTWIVIGRRLRGGRTVGARDEEAGWRWRYAVFCLGGGLANACVSAAAFQGMRLAESEPIALLAAMLGTANAIGVLNLLPFQGRVLPSDGRQIRTILTADAAFVRRQWLGGLELEVEWHWKAGRQEEARLRAESLLLRAPTSLVANVILARWLWGQGRWGECLARCRVARGALAVGAPRPPKIQAEVLHGLARAALRTGDPAVVAEAVEAAEAARALTPDRVGLAETCAEARRRSEAVGTG